MAGEVDGACKAIADEHGTDGNQAAAESRRVQLPPQQMAALRAQQVERRAAFERQRQQVGRCRESLHEPLLPPVWCVQLECCKAGGFCGFIQIE